MEVARQLRLVGTGDDEESAPEAPRVDLTAIWLRAFPKFWAAYPRKVAKKEAIKAWLSIRPSKYGQFKEEGRQIMRLLNHWIQNEWNDSEPKRICYPATWLRRESFEASDVDEVCGE